MGKRESLSKSGRKDMNLSVKLGEDHQHALEVIGNRLAPGQPLDKSKAVRHAIMETARIDPAFLSVIRSVQVFKDERVEEALVGLSKLTAMLNQTLAEIRMLHEKVDAVANRQATAGATPRSTQAAMTAGATPRPTQAATTAGATPRSTQAATTAGATPRPTQVAATAGATPRPTQVAATAREMKRPMQERAVATTSPTENQAETPSSVCINTTDWLEMIQNKSKVFATFIREGAAFLNKTALINLEEDLSKVVSFANLVLEQGESKLSFQFGGSYFHQDVNTFVIFGYIIAEMNEGIFKKFPYKWGGLFLNSDSDPDPEQSFFKIGESYRMMLGGSVNGVRMVSIYKLDFSQREGSSSASPATVTGMMQFPLID